MKVIRNDDNNNPLTPAELEALRQFERSDRDGQVLFRPVVGAGAPAPGCVALFEGIGRFAVVIPEGRHTVRNGQWWRQEAKGVQTPVEDPLERAWLAAESVRTALKQELEIGTYVMAAVWFPDMPEEDEDILDEADGRSVHLLFGEVDLVQRLASLPRGKELQSHLNRRFIKREVEVLSRSSGAKAEPEPAEVSDPVSGRAGALIFHGGVGTVNVYVYVTVVNGGEDDAPPLITVQGR